MECPTLIVGIGGIGGDIVRKLARRVENEKIENVELVVMDTDVNDLRTTAENYRNIKTVQTSPKGTVGKALDRNEAARKNWFPVNDGLIGKPFTEGAGQVRAVSRLAFDHAVEQGLMENLEKAITKLHGLTGTTHRQEMRIIITGSIAGGTGSGLVLPVAMYIRNFLDNRYRDSSAIIRGFFLEPDVVFGRIIDENERNTQRANAYAAVRELDAFFRKSFTDASDEYKDFVFNAPQPGSGIRIDYPNILPYHFVFLMDACNQNGDSLTDIDGKFDLEAYKRHAADCIYAQALSAVSARSNSSEDNVIRMINESSGRSRYCGAGTSMLEYPKDAVQRYIAYNWANEAISKEWMEIDKGFKIAQRDNQKLSKADYYTNTYSSLCLSGSPFFKQIAMESEIRDENGDAIDMVENYIEDLRDRSAAWVEDDLLSNCSALRRCLESSNKSMGIALGKVIEDPDSVKENVADTNDASQAAMKMGNEFQRKYQVLTRYISIAKDEVPEVIRAAANAAFTLSDSNDHPLVNNTNNWQIETILHSVKENGKGTYHPSAVRNTLYQLMAALDAERTDSQQAVLNLQDKLDKATKRDWDEDTEALDTIDSAIRSMVSNSGKGSKLPSLPFNSKTLSDADIEGICNFGSQLNAYIDEAANYVRATASYEFFNSAYKYVADLSAAYETFYDFLEEKMEDISSRITSLETNPDFNNSKGKTHRYVCANTECLEAMKAECINRSSSADLDAELCGEIYESLLRFAKERNRITDRTKRSEVSSEMFGDLFDKVVISYWMDKVMDLVGGYPGVIDKSIIQAIRDEAHYTDESVFFDKKSQYKFDLDYVQRTLDQAQQLATPFIEPPAELATPRNIRTCAFGESAFRGCGALKEDVRRLLINSYNGYEAKDKEFDQYRILFYSSIYGYCATKLPKYAPARNMIDKYPEGEYHSAYYQLVNTLSPNLRKNKYITPHIDKRWHLACVLPDLSDEYELYLNQEIVHAFLFGLIFQKFDVIPMRDGDDIYYVKATKGYTKSDLWVSNGTPCDKFYEIFDALKNDPPVVKQLIKQSKERMENEKNTTVSLDLHKSALIRQIRSKAFEGFDFDEWSDRILHELDVVNEQGIKASTVRPYVFKDGVRHGAAATNLFGSGCSDCEEIRTSLFDIPLLYRVSLPNNDGRPEEIDMMISSLFDIIKNHFKNICDGNDLEACCYEFFEEQYMLFEYNLIGYEKIHDGIRSLDVVSATREKVVSYLEDSRRCGERINAFQNMVKSKWEEYRRKNG